MKQFLSVIVIVACATASFATPTKSHRQIIPAAAHVEGSDDSFWTTDVTLFNPSEETAVVLITLFSPPSANSQTFFAVTVTVEAGQTLVLADILGFGQNQGVTGALLIESDNGNGEAVPIVATSRTSTPGTYGQGIAAIAWDRDGDLSEPLRILTGLESSDEFRSNVGFFNPSPEVEITLGVEIFDAAGATQGVEYYLLEPGAFMQRNNILDEFGAEGTGYTALVYLLDSEGPDGVPADFVTYASKIDRLSNDPSYIAEQMNEDRWGTYLDRIVPVAAHVEGENNSLWRTTLSLYFPDDAAWGFVTLNLIPAADWEGPDPDQVNFIMSAGQTLVIEDVLGEKFPGHQVGALQIGAVGTASCGLNMKVDSRTWTEAGNGIGSLGQGIPGMSMAPGDEPVAITGLAGGGLYGRVNLGIVNLSHNLREVFDVEISDAAGISQGHVPAELEPWTLVQLNGVLEDLGLSGDGYTATVSMTSYENLMLEPSELWDPFFMAYGSTVDNMTNDPTYLAAATIEDSFQSDKGDWYDFESQAPWYVCPDDEISPEATVVSTFNQAYHYFGAENHRSIVDEVEFPTSTEWNQVGLKLKLECPENGICDNWDRTASLQLVLNPDDPEDEWQYLEVMRYITPYNIGMCQYVDITALAPLLTGPQTLVSWIDTWVGPGHSDGEGWRITYDFIFYPGEDRTPDEVINVWGRRSLTLGNIDPEHNVASQIEAFNFDVPADAERIEVRLMSTGHSFGNTDNCAEFCPLRQDIIVNNEMNSILPWRVDCEYNPFCKQAGTWKYDRNGWCPGAIAVGHTIDVTGQIEIGASNVLDFDVVKQDGEEYENTDPGGATPLEWISMQIFIYR